LLFRWSMNTVPTPSPTAPSATLVQPRTRWVDPGELFSAGGEGAGAGGGVGCCAAGCAAGVARCGGGAAVGTGVVVGAAGGGAAGIGAAPEAGESGTKSGIFTSKIVACGAI